MFLPISPRPPKGMIRILPVIFPFFGSLGILKFMILSEKYCNLYLPYAQKNVLRAQNEHKKETPTHAETTLLSCGQG
jgi:hypothetical protein